MAFNNTRTILLHGPRGMEWYCPTPARPPWETEKRHHQEVYRDTSWAAKPFPSSQPTVLGECATPGWEKRWSWTYIEACSSNNGLSRHFLRRNPYGELLLREHLIGHTYRILMNAANGVLPAQPDSHWPEPHCSRPLMSLHCYTDHNDKGEEIEYHYITYKLPNGAPQLAPKVAANRHALQKRDGSWCLLPKTETEVPESWQPKPSGINKSSSKESAQKPVLKALAEGPTAALNVIKESASAVKDMCVKAVTKALEVGHSLFVREPNATIHASLDQQSAKPHEGDVAQPPSAVVKDVSGNYGANTPVLNYGNAGNGAGIEVSRSGNAQNFPITNLPNYQMSSWSWSAIQITTGNNDTYHCLRCSPEGRLLLKKQLLHLRFSIKANHVDCLDQAEPSQSSLQEASSLVAVQLGPNNYFVANALRNGAPEMPSFVFSTHNLIQATNGSWCLLPKNESAIPGSWQLGLSATQKISTTQNVAQEPVLRCQSGEPVLEANAEEPVLKCELKEPPTVLKKAEVNNTAKSTPNGACTEASRNSQNYPITNLPNYPIPSSPTYPIFNDLETLISDYLVCSPAQRTVLLLWLLHTYTFKSSPITPYLNISSPVEESGKSTCMIILRSLCAHPWWAAGTSPSALKKKISSDHPAVLLDNWHTLFRGTDKQQMTGFLLSGCDSPKHFYDEGSQKEIEHTFCPKAFAGMEPLPPTLARRSIPIILLRRKPQEKVKSTINLAHTTRKFTSWIQNWAEENQDQIAKALAAFEAQSETQTLAGLSPHQQQSANVLLALAEVLGGDWPQKARAALLEIFSQYNGSQVSPIQLLSDIRDAFGHHGNPQRLFTAELLPYLHDLDHRTYDQWNKQGDPMTASALARILNKHFEIYPRTQRRGKKDGKEERFKGYQLPDFQEVWERYLPPLEAAGESAKQPEHQSPVSIQTNSQSRPTTVSANKNARCHDVTLQKSATKMPASKVQISSITQFKSGCQRVLKKLVAKAVGLVNIL